MKRTLYISLLFLAAAVFIASCSKQQKPVNFIKTCFEENPGRSGIPLSQLEMLYEGVRKAGDSSAKQTIQENCPIAASKYLL